ncbi:hypothetical protein C8A01DRAFT_14874 [Parachaetomium inaequale]|uniref:Uncharacterized protein n=1 Tax=Parachaetomium inaequale TaxID=2588326 RepID=A0AAN6PMT9_9PEZI|nr:hypothetical protein C8A01DRAFT_14874 [Parachaetomium inaequale]
MRTASVLAAALVAVSSVVASQDAARPKYYFPRHVKRQLTNATITSQESLPPSSSTETTSETTKRQSESDSDSSSGSKVVTITVSRPVFVLPTPTPDSSSTTVSTSDTTTSSESSSESSTSETSSESSSTSSTSTTESSSSESSTSESPTIEPEQPSSTPLPTPPSNSTSSPVDEPTSAVPDSTSTSEEPPVSTTSTSEILLAPTGIVTTSSSEPGNVLSSLLGGILNPSENATSTVSPSPTDGITGPGTGVVTTDTATATGPPATETTPTLSDPGLPPVTNSTIPPASTIPPDPPVTTSTIIDPGTNATTRFTPPPEVTTSTIITLSGNGTIPTGNSTVPPETSAPPTLTSTSTTSTSATSGPEETGGVTEIPPLSTFSATEPYIPSTILVDASSTTADGLAPTSATGIPTKLPSAIAPNNGPTKQPDDTQLIQIGFREGYNYNFVVATDRAAAQIFKYLPQALSEAAGFDINLAQVRRLVPLDTLNSLGYITTCAIVSYPISMVETLSIDIKLPNSPLYNNDDKLIYNLTMQINPAIPITPGQYPDGLGGSAGGSSGGNSGGGGGGGGNGGGSSNSDPFGSSGGDNSGGQSGTQRGTTAGIVSGAVAVAAAYGVVMFVVARRYKRKKQAHRRASSISNPSEMSEPGRGSPALMGGALLSRDFTSSYGAVPPGERNSHGSGRSGMGNSGRTQFISAPVAAENSLGWN